MDLVYNFYYEELANLEQHTRFIEYMNEKRIMTVFHYVPLHSSPAGLKFGRFHGEDRYTTAESERLVRLPMYFGLTQEDQEYFSTPTAKHAAAVPVPSDINGH